MTRRWVLLAVAVAVSGCGYALAGHAITLPDTVRRIGIPDLLNGTDIGDLDRVFTDAVRAEFRSRGRFTVVPEKTGVDAVLTGRIVSVISRAAATTVTAQATKYDIVASVSAEFRLTADPEGKPPYLSETVSVTDQYDVASGTALTSPAAFFSQDQNALERLAKSFARSLVSKILERF